MEHRRRKVFREGNKTATVLMYAAAALLALVCIYPIYYVLIMSLSEAKYVVAGNVYWVPRGFNLDPYKVLVRDGKMWRAYANTILYTAVNTVLNLAFSTTIAYGLCYKKLIGKKFLTMYLLIPMYISGGMIPLFLLIMRLGIYDSPFSLILPNLVGITNIIMIRSYFRTVPGSLEDAARIDGAGVIQVLVNVFIPLSKPIFAVLAVYSIVGNWNSWLGAMLYLPHEQWHPLQMYLRKLLVNNDVKSLTSVMASMEAAKREMSNTQLKYAMIIFTSLPVLFTYPFFQKYFVKGMVLGSLKE